MAKKKKPRIYRTVKVTKGGKCPHCRRLLPPVCPHCKSLNLIKMRGKSKIDGITYFACKDCGRSCKAALL